MGSSQTVKPRENVATHTCFLLFDRNCVDFTDCTYIHSLLREIHFWLGVSDETVASGWSNFVYIILSFHIFLMFHEVRIKVPYLSTWASCSFIGPSKIIFKDLPLEAIRKYFTVENVQFSFSINNIYNYRHSWKAHHFSTNREEDKNIIQLHTVR